MLKCTSTCISPLSDLVCWRVVPCCDLLSWPTTRRGSSANVRNAAKASMKLHFALARQPRPNFNFLQSELLMQSCYDFKPFRPCALFFKTRASGGATSSTAPTKFLRERRVDTVTVIERAIIIATLTKWAYSIVSFHRRVLIGWFIRISSNR